MFGGSEALPPALLNAVYGTAGGRVIKGDALAIAALLNRLQRASALPLLFTADFEGGAGYIVDGATRLPRAMALGATRDPALAERAGRLGAGEGRALGVHVDFYPVVDVNVNPANPVINIRSFGEDPELVARMATAYMRGIQAGGMLATAKHFPGHGDTATDTHLDLAVVEHPRSRLDAVELVPFRAAIAAGIDAVMSSHIRLPGARSDRGPARDAQPPDPHRTAAPGAGLHGPHLHRLDVDARDQPALHAGARRGDGGGGRSGRRARLARPRGRAARDPGGGRARRDPARADRPLGRADPRRQGAPRAPPRRARWTWRRCPARVGGRAHEAVAARDRLARDHAAEGRARARSRCGRAQGARVLLLSVVDYASGWREGAPGRVLIPELRKRFPGLTAVEVTDRTTADELDLVRALARSADAVVAATFVRAAAGERPHRARGGAAVAARGPRAGRRDAAAS